MFHIQDHHRQGFSPLYFLSALGAGGLAVTFFMVPMFWLPHPGTPIPTYEGLVASIATAPTWLAGLSLACLVGFAIFSAIHIRLLVWNIQSYRAYTSTPSYTALRKSHNEVQLMAIPLTLAMPINVGFMVGALFVPGLWSIVEYLFPAAIVGFVAVGLYAVKIYGRMLVRALTSGGFQCENNNNLSQMLSVFAFAMVSVGLAAPAAMSHTPLTSGIALTLSVMFLTFAVVLTAIQMVLGMRSMMLHGVSAEGAASLWIMVPIMTLFGITIFRLRMASAHNFGVDIHPLGTLAMLTVLVSLQIGFGAIGYQVMKATGYMRTFVHTHTPPAHTFALICPGVAFFVLWNFFINKGFVACGLMDKFDLVWFLSYIPAVLVLGKTLQVYIYLTHSLSKAKDLQAQGSRP